MVVSTPTRSAMVTLKPDTMKTLAQLARDTPPPCARARG
jgi:hypothetical protein